MSSFLVRSRWSVVVSVLWLGLLVTPLRGQELRIDLLKPTLIGDATAYVPTSDLELEGRVVPASGARLIINDVDVPVAADGTFTHHLVIDEQEGTRVLVYCGNLKGERTHKVFKAVVGGPPDPEPAVVAEPEPVPKKPVPPDPVPVEPAPALEQRMPERGVEEARPLPSREQLLGARSSARIFALVVGISQYEAAGRSDLPYAKSDAEAFHAHLRSPEGGAVPDERLHLLRDGEARTATILLWLKELLAEAGEDDLFIFYFSGHGENNGKDELCLLGYDTRTSDPERMWSTGLRQQDILEAFRGAKCRKRLMILDACRSGLIASIGERSAERPEAVLAERLVQEDGSLMILAAASGDQRSYESQELGGGIFTHYLIKGLGGAADGSTGEADGFVQLHELEEYLEDHVDREAQRLADGRHQNPVCMCSRSREVTLAVVPDRPADVVARGGEGPEPVQAKDYVYQVEAADRSILDQVVFSNEQGGDKVVVAGLDKTTVKVSGRIGGQVFVLPGKRKGSMIELTDRTRVFGTSYLKFNPEWDEVEVELNTADGHATSRMLRRQGLAERRPIAVRDAFVDPVNDARLEVYTVSGDHYRMAGHVRGSFVVLGGNRVGDVVQLKEMDRSLDHTATLLLSDGWDALTGTITLEQGETVPVDLKLTPHDGLGSLENARFAAPLSPGQTLTFSGQRGSAIACNGQVGEHVLDLYGNLYGEVFVFKTRSGLVDPGRLLLKQGGRQLIGSMRFPGPPGAPSIVVQVDMERVR
ncbi:MAG: caspase family protein [Flavobacteriales bacterium]|nr:caspase family protein [Flavobacteriales bacterium]